MFYEWDIRKEKDNLKKHGLSLGDGVEALEDPDAEFWIDDRYDYDEERTITLGLGIEGVLYVVTTEITEELTRIISVRKAEAYEEVWYRHGRP